MIKIAEQFINDVTRRYVEKISAYREDLAIPWPVWRKLPFYQKQYNAYNVPPGDVIPLPSINSSDSGLEGTESIVTRAIASPADGFDPEAMTEELPFTAVVKEQKPQQEQLYKDQYDIKDKIQKNKDNRILLPHQDFTVAGLGKTGVPRITSEVLHNPFYLKGSNQLTEQGLNESIQNFNEGALDLDPKRNLRTFEALRKEGFKPEEMFNPFNFTANNPYGNKLIFPIMLDNEGHPFFIRDLELQDDIKNLYYNRNVGYRTRNVKEKNIPKGLRMMDFLAIPATRENWERELRRIPLEYRNALIKKHSR